MNTMTFLTFCGAMGLGAVVLLLLALLPSRTKKAHVAHEKVMEHNVASLKALDTRNSIGELQLEAVQSVAREMAGIREELVTIRKIVTEDAVPVVIDEEESGPIGDVLKGSYRPK